MDSFMPQPCGPPPSAAIYADMTTAAAALQNHAKAHGYALFKRDSQPPKREPIKIIYACDREGKDRSISFKLKDPAIHEKRQRPGSRSKKCGCKMKIALKKDMNSGNWESQVIEGSHNHDASADASAYPAHRIAALDPQIVIQIESLTCSGLSNAQILAVIRHERPTVLLAQKDVLNLA
jgi:hypothetical protein